MSFEELRAIKRGWMDKNWRKEKKPLAQISGNAVGSENLPEHLTQSLAIDTHPRSQYLDGGEGGRPGKSHRTKVKGETTQTQTGE